MTSFSVISRVRVMPMMSTDVIPIAIKQLMDSNYHWFKI